MYLPVSNAIFCLFCVTSYATNVTRTITEFNLANIFRMGVFVRYLGHGPT